MEPDYIKISEYAKRMSLGIRKVYRDYHKGLIEGYQEKETGTIRLKNPFLKKDTQRKTTKAVLYTRVSSSQNKSNLDSQLGRVKSFAIAKGLNIVAELKEVGSGLNDHRQKLLWIFDNLDSFDVLVIEHKDRLTRFGFNYIEKLLNTVGKEIIIINEVENNKEDLIQDFVSVIIFFCARIYGQRRCKRKTEDIIEQLKENEEIDETSSTKDFV